MPKLLRTADSSNPYNTSLQTGKKSGGIEGDHNQGGGSRQSGMNSTSQPSGGDGQPRKDEDSNHENESGGDENDTQSEVNLCHLLYVNGDYRRLKS